MVYIFITIFIVATISIIKYYKNFFTKKRKRIASIKRSYEGALMRGDKAAAFYYGRKYYSKISGADFSITAEKKYTNRY